MDAFGDLKSKDKILEELNEYSGLTVSPGTPEPYSGEGVELSAQINQEESYGKSNFYFDGFLRIKAEPVNDEVEEVLEYGDESEVKIEGEVDTYHINIPVGFREVNTVQNYSIKIHEAEVVE